MKSPAWKVYGYVILVFALGICTGVFAGLRLGKQQETSSPLPTHEEYQARIIGVLTDELDLTPEQVDRLPSIVKKTITANQGTTARMMAEIEANTLKLFEEISKDLSEDQKKKLQALEEYYRANKIKIINAAIPIYQAISDAF